LLRLEIRHLSCSPVRGESVEAWARRERHRALADMAQACGASLMLLAHHRRDQAETVLLQTLRGGTPASTSAMPMQAERGGVVWARPWLGMPPEAIQAYVRRHRLKHITDPSNADTAFDRNRLRLSAWSALVAAFPEAEAGLAAAALQAQASRALVDEVAALDIATAATAEGALKLADWLQLSEARRRFALAAWLRRSLGRAAPESLLGRLLEELPNSRSASWPLPRLADGSVQTLRLYRGLLWPDPDPPASSPSVAGVSVPLVIDGPGQMPFPEFRGTLCLQAVESGGIARERLLGAALRRRQGGDRFQASSLQPARSLKLQFQSAGIPAWARSAPLMVSAAGTESAVLYVPGLGVDARALAPPGVAQCLPVWKPALGPL
jgi:tRNA(Ile)-lysidine synthase